MREVFSDDTRIGGAPRSLLPPDGASSLTKPSSQGRGRHLLLCFHEWSWKASSITSGAVSPATETTRRTCVIAWPSRASAHGSIFAAGSLAIFAKKWLKPLCYVNVVTDHYSTSYKRVRIRGFIWSFVDYCV